jgi:hypothetical protein
MEHPQPFAFDPHREALAALALAPGSVYLLLDVAFRNCVRGSSAPKSQGIITAEFPTPTGALPRAFIRAASRGCVDLSHDVFLNKALPIRLELNDGSAVRPAISPVPSESVRLILDEDLGLPVGTASDGLVGWAATAGAGGLTPTTAVVSGPWRAARRAATMGHGLVSREAS